MHDIVLEKLVACDQGSGRLNPQANPAPSDTSNSLLYNLLGDLYSEPDSEAESTTNSKLEEIVRQELNSYIKQPLLSMNSCPLVW